MGAVSEISLVAGANAWSPREAPWPPPTRKVIVVASARNEGIYLLEWVAHYLLLEADSILIYTNDNLDGSDELLRALAQHIPQVSVVFNNAAHNVSAQRKAYQHALAESPLVAEHEWAAFLDIDEFACLKSGGAAVDSLPRFVNMISHTYGASLVSLNWRMQFDSPSLEYCSDLVNAQYPLAAMTTGVKSICRLRDCVRFRTVHRFDTLPGTCAIDGYGQPAAVMCDVPREPPLGWIRHYWHRSFVEFDARLARGVGTQPIVGGQQRTHAEYFTRRSAQALHDPAESRWVNLLRETMARLLRIPDIAESHSRVRLSTEANLRSRARALRDLFDRLSQNTAHKT